jgi:hypothetical protein
MFGNLIAVKENGKNKKGELYWLFQCVLCGRKLSILGRWVRRNPNAKRCDCGEKERKMLESKGLTKRKSRNNEKPRNNEQFAMDIYNMYIKEGWSVRDAATEEGYKRGSVLTRLLMEYIPEYRERSIERRKKSKDNEANRRARKLSRLYHYESDFQTVCAGILKKEGIPVQTNVRKMTGYEIDILASGYCLELKTRVAKKDIYRAMGQLQINASRSNLRPGLVVPSDVDIDKGLVREMQDQGVILMTEKNLVVSIT